MSSGGERPAPEAVWAAVRQRYEDGREAVSAVASSLGISAQALTSHARRQSWKLRGPSKPKSTGTRETIARLKALLQQRLSDIEGQIGAIGEAANATTSERDIRSMNTLVRTLEKVLELERKERSHRKQQRKQQRQFDDAEREALAEKLEGLRRELESDDDVETPDGPGSEPAQP